MPTRAPQVFGPGQPPQRSWPDLNFAERQRLYGYGRRTGLGEADTQAAYQSGTLGTNRYQRGVVRGIGSGRRPIQFRGLFERSPTAQRRYVREAQRHVPNATPQQVDQWIREGSFRPAARQASDRIPAFLVGRDPAYAANASADVFGTPVNNLDLTQEDIDLRTAALNEASNFVLAERESGNTKADENKTRERINEMTPEQLQTYMSQSDSERKTYAMADPVDFGDGQFNLWHYH